MGVLGSTAPVEDVQIVLYTRGREIVTFVVIVEESFFFVVGKVLSKIILTRLNKYMVDKVCPVL